MCVIIVTPVDSQERLPTHYFEKAANKNPDGMGIGWVEDGIVRTWKTMRNLDMLIRKYDTVFNKGESPIVLHFRIATQGMNTIRNCHPFEIPNHNLLVAHNGHITMCEPNWRTKQNCKNLPNSDTRIFVRDYLAHLPNEFWLNGSILRMMEKIVSASKLVFLDGNGVLSYINQSYGTWLEGFWFSNTYGIIEPEKKHSSEFQHKKHTKKKKGKKSHDTCPAWLPASAKYNGQSLDEYMNGDDVTPMDGCPECEKNGILCAACWYDQAAQSTGWDDVDVVGDNEVPKILPFSSTTTAKDWESSLSWAFLLRVDPKNETGKLLPYNNIVICIQCLAVRAETTDKKWDYTELNPIYPNDIYSLGYENSCCHDCGTNVFQFPLTEEEKSGVIHA